MIFSRSDRIVHPHFSLIMGLLISAPTTAADKFRIGYFEAGYSSIYDNTWNVLKLDFLSSKGMPSFIRQGSEDVHSGALMGFSTVDYSSCGRFLVNTVIKGVEDTSPRSLKIVDDTPPKIAINLEAAKALGFDFSFETLGASDEI